MAQDLTATYQWLEALADELGLDAAFIHAVVPALLDLTRDVAHTQQRPAAPLTAFVVGLAAQQGDQEQAQAIIERITAKLESQ